MIFCFQKGQFRKDFTKKLENNWKISYFCNHKSSFCKHSLFFISNHFIFTHVISWKTILYSLFTIILLEYMCTFLSFLKRFCVSKKILLKRKFSKRFVCSKTFYCDLRWAIRSNEITQFYFYTIFWFEIEFYFILKCSRMFSNRQRNLFLLLFCSRSFCLRFFGVQKKLQSSKKKFLPKMSAIFSSNISKSPLIKNTFLWFEIIISCCKKQKNKKPYWILGLFWKMW